MDGLEECGIFDDVLFIMVGDYGMVVNCFDKMIYFEDFVLWIRIFIEWIDLYYFVLLIWLLFGVDVGVVFKNIMEGFDFGVVKNVEFVKVYLKEDLFVRLYFLVSERI